MPAKKKQRKMITIAIAQQKGGVGKTTLARHLVHFLSEKHRVLVMDFDPQRNFTKTFADRVPDGGIQSRDLFRDSIEMNIAQDDTIGVIAASRDLVDVAAYPTEQIVLPRQHLSKISDQFDFCVIDTPPTLGQPLYAALIAADVVVCPITMDQDAMDGLGDLTEDILRVQQHGLNPDLQLLGYIANMVNPKRAFDRQALASLRDALGDQMFSNELNNRAPTQYSKDTPVWSKKGVAGTEMRNVCAEIKTRIEKTL